MRPKQLIIHHSLTADGQTVSWPAIRRYHKSWAHKGKIIQEKDAKALMAEGKTVKHPWADIGYNLGTELIGGDYEILFGRMLDTPGAHTRGQNNDSLGIVAVGNFDLAPPPPEQWSLLIKLCRSLLTVFEIPLENVKGHRDYADKSCPGKLFDMQKLIDDIAKLIIGKVRQSSDY